LSNESKVIESARKILVKAAKDREAEDAVEAEKA
jgi:hypothetical protein